METLSQQISSRMPAVLVFIVCFCFARGSVMRSDSYLMGILNAFETRLNELEEQQKTCLRKVSELKSVMETEQSLVFEQEAVGIIAFSALLVGHQTGIQIGQKVVFQQIILNEGQAYSAATGVFEAPQSGVYMFAYFLGHGSETGQVWLELIQNGLKVNAGVADQLHEYQDVQGGNFAILKLAAGDEVWIQAFYQANANLDGNQQFTSFSGALLR